MLLDTSGLLRLHNRAEPGHEEAWDLFREARTRITHSFVLSEFISLAIARKLALPPAIDFLMELHEGGFAEVTWVDETLYRRGMELLRQRHDKSWSLCDAVSFVLMENCAVREALTTDRHFEQAGFIRLLKP